MSRVLKCLPVPVKLSRGLFVPILHERTNSQLRDHSCATVGNDTNDRSLVYRAVLQQDTESVMSRRKSMAAIKVRKADRDLYDWMAIDLIVLAGSVAFWIPLVFLA
jgi:hypothetical protein